MKSPNVPAETFETALTWGDFGKRVPAGPFYSYARAHARAPAVPKPGGTA